MDWLLDNVEKYPDKIFINDITYAQAYKLVLEYAHNISSRIKEFTRVAICPKNNEKTILLLLSLLSLRKEIVLINSHLTHEEKIIQCKNTETKILITDCTSFSSSQGITFYTIDKILEKDSKSEENPPQILFTTSPEQTAFIINTSGTTGKSKTIKIMWKHIISHVYMSKKKLGVTQNDVWLIVLPIFHVGGLMIIFRSLYNGTSIKTLEKFDCNTVLNLIRKEEVNMISLVPTMLNKIIDKITTHNLRLILLGGESTPLNLINKIIDKKIPVYKTYGMTETLSQIATFNLLEYPNKKLASGLPLENVKIKIVDKDKNNVGKIYVSSPTNTNTSNDYFNTNDYGYLDKEGFLYVISRRNDLIISGGENIYPKEIENVLYELNTVEECIVLPIENSYYGQRPILHIVTSESEENIRKFLLNKIAKYKVPDHIIFHAKLPRNILGKIDVKALMKIHINLYNE
ncbi:o-succinylbenzoate--CoA ligase [Actinomyces sp. zg-332]|uniref:o-succinylbenzoate--CoA ligase n=1 Tax=Actinomyces sp. zg-332 TaxID=2708340 RepID=UPI0014223594|nr:o-succinylbenzoate--CoA ligase [Actinomyces sp. zg-332]QPK93841.1 o-succinylbenzoate--CoA ligase [Actinomyces sp. zg-332]